MKYEHITEGRFIDRPNRFIAHVEINGQVYIFWPMTAWQNLTEWKFRIRYLYALLLTGNKKVFPQSAGPIQKLR